ncbi:DMT family transporter [Rhizobium tumorigenes]|uniref:DMT family transporter n=1 Tax=Rhizobium tumorigenes TaxID=2041385 RepID=A0AAF1KM30_9HYPH|nr:DMT family transporter [Rhizobium tumorigenes]WFR94062.1 DMT family transporter [Rhizobium tumorigenes]
MQSPSHTLSRRHSSEMTMGLTLMFVSVMLSPIVDIFSKLAAVTIPPVEVTAARFLFQCLFALPMIVWKRSWVPGTWRQRRIHALRGGLLVLSMITFVTTLQVMEVADAIAIFFVQPIILTVLSSVFLKETVGWRRYAACVVGFCGALLIIQPSFQQLGFVALLPVVTALCGSIFVLLTRVLAHSEPASSMQLNTGLWGLLFSVILLAIGSLTGNAILSPVMPDATAALHLLGVGVTAAVCGMLTLYAYRAVRASTLAPLQYFEIISATIFGWLVFDNFPNMLKWVGILIIICSGLYILWRERRLASKPVSDTSQSLRAP